MKKKIFKIILFSTVALVNFFSLNAMKDGDPFSTGHPSDISNLALFEKTKFNRYLITASYDFVEIYKIEEKIKLRKITDFKSDVGVTDSIFIKKNKNNKNLLILVGKTAIKICNIDDIGKKDYKPIEEKREIGKNLCFMMGDLLFAVIDSELNLVSSIKIFNLNQQFDSQDFEKEIEHGSVINGRISAITTFENQNKNEDKLFICTDKNCVNVYNIDIDKITSENKINKHIKFLTKIELNDSSVNIQVLKISKPFLFAGGVKDNTIVCIFIFKIDDINNIKKMKPIVQSEKETQWFFNDNTSLQLCGNALFKLSAYNLKIYSVKENFKEIKNLRNFDDMDSAFNFRTMLLDERNKILFSTENSIILTFNISQYTDSISKDLNYFFNNLGKMLKHKNSKKDIIFKFEYNN